MTPQDIPESNNEPTLPRAMINFFAAVGRLVDDAEFYPTRSGRPKIVFRLAIPRHPRLPRKKPATGDFYTVVCHGPRFLPLLDHLVAGREVVVFGWAQSRDVDGEQRTVNEIGADAIVLTTDSDMLQALDNIVAGVLATLTPQERASFQETMEELDWQLPPNLNNLSWVNKVAPLFIGEPDEKRRMHPEIRLSVERILTGSEDADGD